MLFFKRKKKTPAETDPETQAPDTQTFPEAHTEPAEPELSAEAEKVPSAGAEDAPAAGFEQPSPAAQPAPTAEQPQPAARQSQPLEEVLAKPPEEVLAKEVPATPELEPEPAATAQVSPKVQDDPLVQDKPPVQDKPKVGFFARMKQGLSRTSNHFTEGMGNLILGSKAIDDELLEDIESQLLIADVGYEATTDIIDNLTQRVARKQLSDAESLYRALREQLSELLVPVEAPLVIDTEKQPYVILVVGVNGVGKTTTIGKLAKHLQKQDKSVMLAAGDTFRAAAVEQLQVWGERNNVPVIAQHTGADSASVVFDGLQAAKARGTDVLIADTAGRLHNKNHLMDELAKVKRVMAKIDSSAPHEVLLVLDAGTGQNAVSQAREFIQSAGVTGLVLTKLDGTAKGGVIFALSKEFSLPVRFIGVGEGVDDLQPFTAKPFVDALFGERRAEQGE